MKYLILALYLLLFFVFIIIVDYPFIVGFTIFQPIVCLDQGRLYYTIVTSIATVLFGFIGLLLGYYYFYYKEIAVRVKKLLEEVEKYNNTINDIFNINFRSNRRLQQVRYNANVIRDNVYFILNSFQFLCEFNKKEKRIFIDLFSFVEGSILYRSDYTNIRRQIRNVDRDIYDDLIVSIREMCYKKMYMHF